MDFCGNGNGNGGGSFQSSVVASGGQDPDTSGWGAQKLNLCVYDVQQTIMEGRMAGTGVWNVDGNPQFVDVGHENLQDLNGLAYGGQ